VKLLGSNRDQHNILKQVGADEYLIDRLPKGSAALLVDIGAQVGLVCIKARLRFPSLRIGAIEPYGESFRYLIDNTEGLGIECVNVGLGDGRPLEPTPVEERATLGCEFRVSNSGSGIPTWTLDQIINHFKGPYESTMWKIDCEGGELALYNEPVAKSVLEKSPMVAFELHSMPLKSSEELESYFDEVFCDHNKHITAKCTERIKHVAYVRKDIQLLY